MTQLYVCCPTVWPAKACHAWPEYDGTPSVVHACDLRPGHDGDHKCPCGRRLAAEP